MKGILHFATAALLTTGAWAADSPGQSSPFEERGVVVDVHGFFTAATTAAAVTAVAAENEHVAGRALVTEKGVFAFLETPQNARQLRDTEPGSVVQVRGKLLDLGALLHVEALEKVTTVPLIDFAGFRENPGTAATLHGVNKCQCGLAVADLPHSCELGHLHHLEADDGKLYHYLQFASGKDAFLGHGSHFKEVEVTARVLPGQYLLVQKMTVK